jgi:hypothetical protein
MELAISVCNIFSSQSGGFFKLSDNYAAARKITRRPSQNRQHYLNFFIHSGWLDPTTCASSSTNYNLVCKFVAETEKKKNHRPARVNIHKQKITWQLPPNTHLIECRCHQKPNEKMRLS